MILLPDPSSAWIDPFARRKTLVLHCHVHDPVTGEPYSRDPRHVVRKAEDHLRASGIADTCYVGPEAEFFIFDSVNFSSSKHAAHYEVDSVEGSWNTGRRLEPDGTPNRGYKPREKEGYFPLPAHGPLPGPADRDDADPRAGGHRGRDPAPRGRLRRPGRDRHPLRRARPHGRQADGVQVRGQERRLASGQVGHLHAQADLRRQRLGHARPPVAVEGGRTALLRRDRLRRSVRPGPLVHRRPARPRPVAAGVHQPDDELLQAPGPRLRGAGEPGVLAAQPVGRLPHPAVLEVTAGQADRVPLPRPVGQSLPGVLAPC